MDPRENQYHRLLNYFGTHEDLLPSCLFIWGLPSSGKTFILQKALSDATLTHASINTAEIMCGVRPFLESIVKQVTGFLPKKNSKFTDQMFLVESFRQFYENRPHERVLLVIKDAEKLRNAHSDLLQLLLTFHEYVENANICIVLCSHLPPCKYNGVPNLANGSSVNEIHFPCFKKDQLVNILTEINATYLSGFVSYVVNASFCKCRDLKKLNRLIKLLWTRRHSFQTENNGRTMRSYNIKKLNELMKDPINAQVLSSSGVNYSQNCNQEIDMPMGSKFLLIASYLASHNPVTSDCRFFTVGSSGAKKRKVELAKPAVVQNAKIFPFQRLVAIYCAIFNSHMAIKNHAEINDIVRVQLASLCHSRYIQSISNERMGGCRYRCLLDYETALRVSKSIGFQIDRYLISKS